jgi:drug/metabolite transporter (DMT)-like permease
MEAVTREDGSPNMTALSRGVPPLVAFSVLSAAVDVYAGNRLQAVDPGSVAALSFTVTTALFVGAELGRRGRAALRPVRAHAYDVAALNITTALTWLSLLYALKWLEPALVNVVSIAMGPACTILLVPLLRRGSVGLPIEIAVSLAILAVLVLLLASSFAGLSSLGDISAGRATAGAVATVICGMASAANVIYSKRLSDAGLTPRSVLAVRFFAIVVISWAVVAGESHPHLLAALPPALVVTVIGVAAPMYLIQLGVRHTEPITVSLLASLAPVVTYVLQLGDPRLRPSPVSLACVLTVTALVSAGVIARHRYDSAGGREPSSSDAPSSGEVPSGGSAAGDVP